MGWRSHFRCQPSAVFSRHISRFESLHRQLPVWNPIKLIWIWILRAVQTIQSHNSASIWNNFKKFFGKLINICATWCFFWNNKVESTILDLIDGKYIFIFIWLAFFSSIIVAIFLGFHIQLGDFLPVCSETYLGHGLRVRT